jgi:beta-glucosidase
MTANITGTGGWEMGLKKAKAFVAQLTIEEKADMVTGQAGPCVGNIVAIPRLGFPGLCLQDGPLAIRVADYASVFSAGVSAGATWDKDIMYERGYAMGEEFRAKGAQVMLGPVAGPLGRSGYAGRNWEGFSSDPYLSGIAMEKTITAAQDVGVQACAKHWVGNEQEIQRNPEYSDDGVSQTSAALSSNIDDRTMHVSISRHTYKTKLTLNRSSTCGHSPMPSRRALPASCAVTSESTAATDARTPSLRMDYSRPSLDSRAT